MADKSLTLILFQADRIPWQGAGVRLLVTDLNSSELKVLHDQRLKAGTSTVVMNLELLFDAGQRYGVSVDVSKHRSAVHLINHKTFLRQDGGTEIEVDEAFVRLILVPRKPKSSNLDEGYERLRAQGSPVVGDNTGLAREAYLALEPEAKMAFLNIEAKLRETRLTGRSLLSFVEGVRFVDVDRVFLLVRSDLKQIVKDSSVFASAPGHGAPADTPIALPAHPDSWKHTLFGAGNLQLSFSANSETLVTDPTKQVFSVDADIDLARGVDHFFEWLKNHFTGKKTDQTLVYSLLFAQGINAAYTLDPLEPA